MSQQLPGLEGPSALTERQRFALELIRARGPIGSEELGAVLHAYRREHGGRGHAASEMCAFCLPEGAQMGRALHRKGLVRRRRGEGWVEVFADGTTAAPYGSSAIQGEGEIPF